ncbi:hypothetical protein G7Z17_g3174 [Cylindrodendrum hubeiense]|uniref:Transcription factor domain-containing protein n=1 Tax=Cylindrodendrum hubeiense TaxID=595255 RepID=A0A9P5LJL5_9HYPO|nr:hypothetical protein G7Z17_g3174 [Cylindrodendrum hubeiense]
MSPNTAGQSAGRSTPRGSRLWKRLWWSGSMMEQLHFLRYSLEEPVPFYPPCFALDPRTMEPLLLEDFDLTPSRNSSHRASEYWICMQQASCFIERAALCEDVAGYVRDRQWKTTSKQLPSRPGQICHDDNFWEVQAIAERFSQFKKDTGFYSVCNDIDEKEDMALVSTHLRLDLVFFRIMIALYRETKEQNDGCNSVNSMWRQLRDDEVTHMARKVLAASRKMLDRTGGSGPSFGAGVEMLRAITVAAGALLSLKTRPLDHRSLLRESRALLRICSKAGCNLWAETAIEHLASPWNLPSLSDDVTEGASPASGFAETPRHDVTEIYSPIEDIEWLEKKRLFNEFDDMWNTTYMKTECTLGHPPGVRSLTPVPLVHEREARTCLVDDRGRKV